MFNTKLKRGFKRFNPEELNKTNKKIYKEAIENCIAIINKMIVPGPLNWSGLDEASKRNGLILASNALCEYLENT